MAQTFKDRLAILVGDQRPYSFSRKAGIDKAVFKHYWRDGTRPKGKNLDLLAAYTGCTMDWLLTGREVDFSKFSFLPTGKDPKSIRLGKTIEKLEQIYRTKDDKTLDGLEFFVETVHGRK